MWYNFKRFNIIIIGIAEAVEMENRAEEMFEIIMAENFPKFMQIQNHSSEKPKQNKYSTSKPSRPKHIIVKLWKTQNKENLEGSML